MRRFSLLILDAVLFLFATVAAQLLRDNFEINSERFLYLTPYLVATAISCLLVFSILGINRSVWRFSNLPDYLRVALSSAMAALGAVALTFAYNRLENIARSLPILQFLAGTALLVGARVAHKLGHDARQFRRSSRAILEMPNDTDATTVVVAGVSRLTETYLQAVAELSPHKIKVVGLLGGERQVGRVVSGYPVLGMPEEVEDILNDLEVHGIMIDRIVVASGFLDLSQKAREAFLRVEQMRSVALQFLSYDLGFEGGRPSNAGRDALMASELSFEFTATELEKLAKRPYWAMKRVFDASLALLLLIVTVPIMIITALSVAMSLGFPILFWQQRPGLGGRPFRVYKFRTMREAHAPNGRRLSDEERVSVVGNFLRRLRLDELPQLLSILKGDMSFVGPRPLLPRDQPKAFRARLLVRPGLTGWAQVVGGRAISAEDKAALDVWYVRKASFTLDLQIAFRTIVVVIFGERISTGLIERAWRELGAAGILKGSLSARANLGLQALSSAGGPVS